MAATTTSSAMRAGMAIVTGASSGIGHSVARLLQRDGWQVHNIARRLCDIPGVVNHGFDLSLPSEAEAAAACLVTALTPSQAPRAKPRIALIHNASAHLEDSTQAFCPEKLLQSLKLSLVAPAILNAAMIKHMGQGSSIIFVGSTLSEKAVQGRMSYVTAKHGTVGMIHVSGRCSITRLQRAEHAHGKAWMPACLAATGGLIERSCAQDLFGTGIHTACICPGFTDTAMLQDAMSAGGDDAKRFIQNFVSLGRLLDAQEIARTLVFAVDNPAVNGSVIHVNGGQRET